MAGEKQSQREALLQTLLRRLGPQDQRQLQAILGSREAQERILSTPEARELLKTLTEK